MYTNKFLPPNELSSLYTHSAYRNMLILPEERCALRVKLPLRIDTPNLARFLATSFTEFRAGFQKIEGLSLDVKNIEEPSYLSLIPATETYCISLDIQEKEKTAYLKVYQVYGESMAIRSCQKLSTMYPSVEEVLALAAQELKLTVANLNGNIAFFSAKKDHLYFSFITRTYVTLKTERLSLEKFKSWCGQLSFLWK